MGLLTELRRRNVIKVCMAYLALCWVAIEVTTTVSPLLALPDWLATMVLWVGIIGLPVIAVLSWIYELTPEGVKLDGDARVSPGTRQRAARRLDLFVISLIAVGVVLLAYDRFGPRADRSTTRPGHEIPTGEVAGQTESNERPAIAVLPFENLSTDPEQAFFADGLAEDLITRLAAWRAFPVIARHSSFEFRGRDLDPQQVSAALGARYLVQGSVRRAADRVRVTAQLIDAQTGESVWADSYDGGIADVFSLQDELTTLIAAALVEDLNRAEANRAKLGGTDDLEAWSLYQLGLRHAGAYTQEEFAVAREHFNRAITEDPNFATALAQVVFIDLWSVVLGWSETPYETIEVALGIARRAVSLDPRDPAAQAALGWAYIMAGDVQNGLVAAHMAVELNPSMPEALGWLSWNLLVAGDPEGAIAYGERSQRLNPLGSLTSVIHDNLSQAHWELGDHDASMRSARRLMADLPDYYIGYVLLALNQFELGRIEDAQASIEKARRIQPDLSLELVQAMYGVERPKVDDRRNAILRKLGVASD